MKSQRAILKQAVRQSRLNPAAVGRFLFASVQSQAQATSDGHCCYHRGARGPRRPKFGNRARAVRDPGRHRHRRTSGYSTL
jgi:hypothetical protein